MVEAGANPITRIDERRWRAVVRALPDGADHALVRQWLDLIAAERSIPPRQRAAEHTRRAQRYREELADLPNMRPVVVDLDRRRAELRAMAEHEDEQAQFFGQFRSHERVSRILILFVWHFILGGELQPAMVRRFYDVAYEFVHGAPASPDKDAFKKLLREFRRDFVAEFKRRPTRFITVFGTEAR
jgi:hypothetical protein